MYIDLGLMGIRFVFLSFKWLKICLAEMCQKPDWAFLFRLVTLPLLHCILSGFVNQKDTNRAADGLVFRELILQQKVVGSNPSIVRTASGTSQVPLSKLLFYYTAPRAPCHCIQWFKCRERVLHCSHRVLCCIHVCLLLVKSLKEMLLF